MSQENTIKPTASDNTEQLIAQVTQAYETSAPVVIEGNGTKRFLGHSIDEQHQIISTNQHSGITSYEPVELVMTARAGTTLEEIDSVLAENGQMLACDPARFGGKATIGGSLASNQAGPSRPWSGSLRDHVLGVNLINGKGEYLRFGGQVMKNVAGYDVSRLQAGAMGTLGLMTEVSFKVLPFCKKTQSLKLACSQREAITISNDLAAQPSPLDGASWVGGELFLRFSGAKSAVEKAIEQQLKQHSHAQEISDDEATRFWEALRDQQLDFFKQSDSPLWRLSIRSTAWDSLNEAFDEDQWLVDWGGALRWLKAEASETDLSGWAEKYGGEAVRYRTGLAQQSDGNQLRFPETHSVSQRIQTHIKNSFDPQRILNVGRLYHWM